MSAHAATTNEGPHYESVTEPLVNMINKAEDAIAAEFESLKATISGITKSTWRAVKNAMRWGKDKVTKAWRALGFGGKATHDTGHGAHAAAAHAPAAGGGGHGHAEAGHGDAPAAGHGDAHAGGHGEHKEGHEERKEGHGDAAHGEQKGAGHADAAHAPAAGHAPEHKKDEAHGDAHAKPEAKKDEHAAKPEAKKPETKHAKVIPFAARKAASKTFSTPVRMAA